MMLFTSPLLIELLKNQLIKFILLDNKVDLIHQFKLQIDLSHSSLNRMILN